MKLTILTLFSFFCISFSTAQEGLPVYFDYLSDNYYLIHPSMAGISEGGKVRATARKQWFDVDNAPSLQTINANMRFGEQSGAGVILFNDANGYHSQTGLKLTYAHHLKMGGDFRVLNQLSFGLSAGIIQSSLDESEFVSLIPDAAITNTKTSVSYYNVDFGMSYNFLEFYAHFTVLNALGTGRDLYTAVESNNLRKYLVSVGYVFGKDIWQIEPSILFQNTDATAEKELDLNAKVYRKMDFGKVWGGLSYRRSFGGAEFNNNGTIESQKLQLLSPILGANYNKFVFAYTYTYEMGNVKFANGGFHQITLGYNFGQPKKRYDCNCPAVNY